MYLVLNRITVYKYCIYEYNLMLFNDLQLLHFLLELNADNLLVFYLPIDLADLKVLPVSTFSQITQNAASCSLCLYKLY